MKIVFLDAHSVGEDLNLTPFAQLGEFVPYAYSVPDEIPARVADADVIITNKCEMNAQSLGDATQLKLVCVTATGTNNLDKDFLDSQGIAWRNVAGYSTNSVAQHTFALYFYLAEHLHYYDQYVKQEKYVNDVSFTHFSQHFGELNGKTWGIIGMGAIGRKVADIATAFGAHVVYHSPSGRPAQEGYHQVDLDTLLATADVVSIHAPLNPFTENMANAAFFAKMKSTALFLNVGRGAIVVEQDLADALQTDTIAGAGLDVLVHEPMLPENPLRTIKDSHKLLITPHIGWASVEARTNLMQLIHGQIGEFFGALHA